MIMQQQPWQGVKSCHGFDRYDIIEFAEI